MLKILLTGICGFVGSTIAKWWLNHRKDYSIIGLDNFIRPGSENNRLELKTLGADLYHADIRISSDFEGLPDADYLIDAAANPSVLAGVDGTVSTRQLVEHNLYGTINMLEYCKKYQAGFILLSTSRVYSIKHLSSIKVETVADAFSPVLDTPITGLSELGVNEDFSTFAPISLYGATKLASETLALEYYNAFNFPVWVNRCGVLAGGGQFGRADQGIFTYWINSWIHEKPLKYIGFDGMGHQVRDCLHPLDLIPLIEMQMNHSRNDKKRIQNVSGGTASACSLKQCSNWCANRYGEHIVKSRKTNRVYDIPWLILDSTLAKDQWGWSPKITREQIFCEIADHAEKNKNWLELSSPM
jgi:CDP-paratose 2-epimerase